MDILSIIFYTLAITSLFLTTHKQIPIILTISGIVFAGLAGYVSWVSLPFFVLIFMTSYGIYQSQHRLVQSLSILGFIIIGFITLLNKIPGMQYWNVISNISLSTDAIPLNLYLAFDAPLLGIAIFLFSTPSPCNRTDIKRMIKMALWLIPTMLTIVIFSAIQLNYVRWDPKWTSLFFVWALSNLWFTSMTEEAIFRRLFQDTLRSLFQPIKFGTYIAIFTASTLFGIAHIAGGINYVILATIAGIFYGTAYHISGRIEASILCHFILNATHFLLFTYPALKTALL